MGADTTHEPFYDGTGLSSPYPKGTQAMTTEEWNDKPTGSAPELKPCPFCGGKRVHYYPSWKPKDNANHRSHPYVRCHTCSGGVNGEEGDYSIDAQSAIAAWNTRADLSQAAIAAAMLAAVKPLEWFGGETYCEANAGIDSYTIESGWKDKIGGIRWWAWVRNTRDDDLSPYFHGSHAESFDAAKAAAQADYQARILSALSISPDALAALEAVKAAVRADIAAWLDTLPNDTTPAGAAILLRKGGA